MSTPAFFFGFSPSSPPPSSGAAAFGLAFFAPPFFGLGAGSSSRSITSCALALVVMSELERSDEAATMQTAARRLRNMSFPRGFGSASSGSSSPRPSQDSGIYRKDQ